MKTPSRLMQMSGAALLGLSFATAAIAPSVADEAPVKKETRVDTRTTGSIPGQACDPNDPKAGIVCHVTRGKPDARFPSAPVNPAFGF